MKDSSAAPQKQSSFALMLRFMSIFSIRDIIEMQ